MYRRFLFLLVAFGPMAGLAGEMPDSLAIRLDDVVVMPDRSISRWEGNTLVSTIVGTPLARLGNALDVLAQLPLTEVSEDGVSVKGRGTPEIYIDGRPVHDLTELHTLQADNIRKVEVLMAPGVRYGTTTRSVLKFTTRHNFIAGLSSLGRTEVKAGRRWNVSEELTLRYFTRNWEIFGEGIYWHADSQEKGTTVHRFLYDARPMEVGSSQNRTSPSNGGVGRIGFNYAKGGKSLGGYYRADRLRSRLYNTGREWIDDTSDIMRVIRFGKTRFKQSAALYYDGTWSEKYRLHFDGAFSHHEAKSNTATVYPKESFLPEIRSTQDNPYTFGAAKLYVEFPVGGGMMTMGTEDSYTRTDLEYRMLNDEVSSYIPSSFTETRQMAWAAFASWQRRFGKVGLSAGVRVEGVDYSFFLNGVKDGSTSRHDVFLSPDISCDIPLSDVASLSFNYRMSTIRPPYAHLTSGLTYTGLHEIEGGNPALQDEHTYGYQLFGMWRDFMLQIEYHRACDTYGFVKELYPASTPQLLMHPVNIDVSSMSKYLMWSKRIQGWMPDVMLGCFTQWLTLEKKKYDSCRPFYRFYNVFSLSRCWMLTATFSGNGAGYIHTQKFKASWFTMDVSVQGVFFDDSLHVRLGANNIFRTDHNGWTLNSYGIITEKKQSYDSRSVSFTLTYKFQPRKSKYLGGNASEAEAGRL